MDSSFAISKNGKKINLIQEVWKYGLNFIKDNLDRIQFMLVGLGRVYYDNK